LSRSRHVVCVDNERYPASLEARKIYRTVNDRDAERHGLLRVVDESGEGYLYPKQLFAEIKLSAGLAKALAPGLARRQVE
jgi:hypothetical protein